MVRLVYLVTVPLTARAFLAGQLQALHQAGFAVTLITSPGKELQGLATQEQVQVITVPMAREISPLADLRALLQIVRLLHRLRPQIVNAGTPKAGLLGMLAAWIVRVPVRIYQLRGLRLETTKGAKRAVLTATERITAWCAHWIVCNSRSLQRSYTARGLAPIKKVIVLGQGSSNGVAPARFGPDAPRIAEAAALRVRHGIPPESIVVGFVGRLTRDKGVVDLVEAFFALKPRWPKLKLLVVGQLEAGDQLPTATVERLQCDPDIILTGFASDPAPYYHMMDVFAFPSYREGFPNAPLEAALANVPTVGFSATGVVDAVINGETGLLVPLGNVRDLATALDILLSQPVYRRLLGENAHARALAEFRPEVVWERWSAFYRWAIDVS